MLLDWIDRWLTPVPLHLREMGYARELYGIRRRWRQWGWAWKSHCENTRRLLLASAARCGRRRKAVLFGSGFLHDIPLANLSRSFEKVVLVDLIHPRLAVRAARRFANVEFLAADITGTVEGVWQCVERPGTPLPLGRPHLFLDDRDVDFVASVNLLSQLPCMPERYLLRWPVRPREELAAYCRHLVESHLHYLRSLSGVVCLVADIEMRTIADTGREVRRKSTLYGATFPFAGERWVWPLVPRAPKPPHHAEHLVVAGVEDVRAAAASALII